jgi:hypothetical protein
VPVDNTVRGIFDRRREATIAVRRLGQQSVPADSIDVFVLDPSGDVRERVKVEDEAGALRGAFIGAAVGAVGGAVIVILVGSGLLGPANVEPLELASIRGAIRAIALAAAAGVPLGALIGMGHWRGSAQIDPDETRGALLMVVVRTKELEEVSQRVLEEAGAASVSTGSWRAPSGSS